MLASITPTVSVVYILHKCDRIWSHDGGVKKSSDMNSHSLDELLLVQSSRKISLIAQNQNLRADGHVHDHVKTKASTTHDPNLWWLTGIPCSCGLSNRLCSSFFDASIFSGSAASTMYLQRHRRSVTDAWHHEGVWGIYSHYSADAAAVSLPHAPEARLTADVPQLQHKITQQITLYNLIITQ